MYMKGIMICLSNKGFIKFYNNIYNCHSCKLMNDKRLTPQRLPFLYVSKTRTNISLCCFPTMYVYCIFLYVQ